MAIIMDGNGRWAERRGRPRGEGHLAGARAVRRTVECARELGIGTLTLHAFSSDNWKRPHQETARLMQLLEDYLVRETPRCLEAGIRLRVAGRRDRLPKTLLAAIESTEAATRGGKELHLRLAVDYSARHSLWQAARLCGAAHDLPVFETLARTVHDDAPLPDVDLLIRCGGEQRLSDLFGWECAHAELLFLPLMWPDFGPRELRAALEEFQRRERRYGALPVAAHDTVGTAVSLAAGGSAGARHHCNRTKGTTNLAWISHKGLGRASAPARVAIRGFLAAKRSRQSADDGHGRARGPAPTGTAHSRVVVKPVVRTTNLEEPQIP